MNEIILEIKNLAERIQKSRNLLKIDDLTEQIAAKESESQKADFWNNQETASKTMTEISSLKKSLDLWDSLARRAEDLLEIAKISQESDHEIVIEIQQGIEDLKTDLDKTEFVLLFGGPYDKNSAIVSVYAGSGGVDAQDWAEMVLSMLLKFCEKRGFETSILDISSGDEAGLKSVTVEVTGEYAFGYLKSEKGVHRLVRISPYDGDKARHTSFALVDILPEVETTNYKVDEKDLKIDTYRASGHGGQGVNTTDSAVRITHLPSGLSVTCQKERSQLQNKNFALHILASRLKLLEEEETRERMSELRGEIVSADWGNQIRSYVLHPYNMVKDHRTDFETSNTAEVLSGDLDGFVEAYLRKNLAKE